MFAAINCGAANQFSVWEKKQKPQNIHACKRGKSAHFSDISASSGGAVPSVPVKSPPSPGFC